MAYATGDASEDTLDFGPFRLLPAQKMLLEAGKPIRLGSRALDILILLTARAGEVVSKDDLVARVWPNTFVEEANLRVHVAALRKALGDGRAGHRYVANVPGRGYCFVAPVARRREPQTEPEPALSQAADAEHNLPAPLTRMIGRDDTVEILAAQLLQRRFVTIAGPGGIGKTTVALAVAERLVHTTDQQARFVDLASITDPSLVASALAAVLGLGLLSDCPLENLVTFLKTNRMLIVLDNCEHVIAAAATLAEGLLKGAPGVTLLATSREPLRAEGEWVHRLSSMKTPQVSERLTADHALTFPSVELFVERATASLETFELTDEIAPVVAELCRRLDGLPLAIELAAARVEQFGVHGLANRLDDRFMLLTQGRRTALRRHQTLRATLDWSYELLSVSEQTVLRRTSVFNNSFSLESACAVAGDKTITETMVFESVSSLVAKSLLTADVSGATVQYRLLDSTHAYGLEKLTASDDSNATFRRHAVHCCDLITAAERDWEVQPTAEWLGTYGRRIDDVRAALDWAFSRDGDVSIGIALTAASSGLWFQLSLMDEFLERVQRALAHTSAATPPLPMLEIQLNGALAHLLQHMVGPGPATTAAFTRTLELAERVDDGKHEAGALMGMWAWAFGRGDYPAATAFSEKLSTTAQRSDDPLAILVSDRMMAQSLHFMGDHKRARSHAENVLNHPAKTIRLAYKSRMQADRRVSMRIVLARILWLEGFSDQAVQVAAESMEYAASDHAFALCHALVLAACPIALWRGDKAMAQRLTTTLLDHAGRFTLGYWQSWGRFYGRVLSLPGDTTARATMTPVTLTSDTKQLDVLGTITDSMVSPDTLARVEAGTVGWCGPEILRAQGALVLDQDPAAAETFFQRSLAMARQQGAMAWQLRSATSLARLWQTQKRTQEAQDLLAPLYGRFTEGLDTADLVAARTVLGELV